MRQYSFKKNRLSLIRNYAYILLFIILLLPASTHALDQSGWMTLASAIVGDDASCGAGKVKHELVILDLNTGAPATPPSSSFWVEDASDVTIDSVSGSGVSVIGPVCFNPDTDSLQINIPNSASYYAFNGGYVWTTSQASLVPRGKFMRTTVWLRPKSSVGFDYRHNNPSGVYLNISPTYKVELGNFPTTYGATGVSRILLFVFDWNTGAQIAKTAITGASVTGGTGVKTLAPQTLPDGLYTWMYYLNLNGNNNLGGGFSTPNVLSSQRSGTNAPFLLDTAAPSFATGVSHSPASPYSVDTVTITANATDNLAGVTEIKIYLDGVLVKTCPYFYTASASCVVSTGPFSPGSNHSYYAVATDGSGNTTSSLTQNFSVAPNTSQAPTITGPVSLVTGVNGTYTFTANDFENDQIRYGIDWNMDSIAEDWLPSGVTYVNSGTTRGTTHVWATAGVKTFQALTQDFSGTNSTWTSYTVNVTAPPLFPIITISVAPLSVPVGSTATISWSTVNATSCAASGNWSGAKGISGSQSTGALSPAGSYTYTLTCTGPDGSNSNSTPVTVTVLPPVCGDGVCSVPETPLTCSKDCRVKFRQF